MKRFRPCCVAGVFTSGSSDFDLKLTSAVPEPARLTTLGIGAVGLLGFAWQRRGARAAWPSDPRLGPAPGRRGRATLSPPLRPPRATY